LRTNGGIESFQTTVDQQGNWRLTPDDVGFVPPDGVYDLNVYYTDSLGNVSSLTEGQITISIASDTTAPTVSTFSPTDGATGVAVSSNIVVTFSETIVRGTGNIELRAGSATGTIVETFNAATSTRLNLSGNQLTIDPTTTLANGTQYFVVMASGTIKDSAGNNYTGTSTYDFTTALVSPTTGNDTISGSWTDDTIFGLAGNDTLIGGAGNDTLDGGAGNDVLTGGDGTDTVSYATATAGVTVSLAVTKSQKTVGSGNDTLSGIENLIGSAFNDVLTGSSTANRIDGASGNDVLNGGGGIDVLDGGEGSDVYLVTLLADKTAAEITDTGTTGTDELRFAATTVGTLTLLAGDTGLERVVIGTGTGASAATTGKVALNVDATASANGLTITGNAGNNTLTGSGFADTLDGGAGNDVLLGGLGNDVLIGGLGQDTLTGGIGNDIFKFSLITESGTTATKSDVITDFVKGQDVIDLSGLDAFLATKNVNDTFIWQGTAAFSNTTQGEVRYEKFDVAGTANDHTMIWIDNDKDTGVEMGIRLTGLHDLAASDFVL
jgi:Ca2+-binding RTX toxin-like protein